MQAAWVWPFKRLTSTNDDDIILCHGAARRRRLGLYADLAQVTGEHSRVAVQQRENEEIRLCVEVIQMYSLLGDPVARQRQKV
jgi:hypothetical protein